MNKPITIEDLDKHIEQIAYEETDQYKAKKVQLEWEPYKWNV